MARLTLAGFSENAGARVRRAESSHVRELAFHRDLRLDPQKALSAFELRAKTSR